MAETTLQDGGDHILTSNGIRCSKSDCVLSTCINSKVGKIKKDSEAAMAQKRKRSSGKVNTVENGMGRSVENGMGRSVTKEQHTELFWEDLGSILEQHALEDFKDTYTGSFNPVLLDGAPHEHGSVAQPSFGQREILLDRSQQQPWMEEQTPRFPFVQSSSCFVKSAKTSRQSLPASQQMVTEQTDYSSQFLSSVPKNSQITYPMTTAPTINIPSSPDIRCDPTHSELGVGTSSLEGLSSTLTEYHKGNTKTSLNSHQVYSTDGQFGSWNASDISRNPRGRVRPMGRLFGILSLILQAFDGPHTAELEECYTSALQRALTEIQAARGLCK